MIPYPPITGAPAPAAPAEVLDGLLPDLRLVLLLVPVALVFAGAAGALAARLRGRGVRVPYTRKVFHFLIFTGAGAVHLEWGLPGVICFGSGVALVVLWAVAAGPGQPLYEALARPTDAPRRSLFVLVPLATTALGGLASNLLFADAALFGYLVAGWGDAVGEPVGARWGRHPYRVPSLAGVPAARTLEGSLAVAAAGCAAALVGGVLAGLPAASAIGVALACGLAGAAVEAFSTHGLDNLTVQLAASGAAFLLV